MKPPPLVKAHRKAGYFKTSPYRLKKKRKNGKATRNLSTAVIGKSIPSKMVMTHKWHETLTLSSESGSLASYSILTNGAYAPNQADTDHAVHYFNTLASIYQRYTVIGSRIIVKLAPTTANTVAAIGGLYVNDNAAITPTSLDGMAENIRATSKLIQVGGNNQIILRAKWSGKKSFGKSILSNNSAGALTNANPTEFDAYTIFVQLLDAGTTQNFVAQVYVEMICVWQQPRDLGISDPT